MIVENRKRQVYLSLLIAIPAAIWGLFWIPLRMLEDFGLSAGWACVSQFAVPALVLAPVALILAMRGKPTGLGLWQTGFLTGGAFAFYAESLLLTEVARALLLFYLTPLWSTLFELWFMRRQLTVARILAIVLGLGGLWVILPSETGLPIPQNAGDWMAIISGMLWAGGSLRNRITGRPGTFREVGFGNVFAFFTYGGIVAFGLTFLPIEGLGTPPTPHQLLTLLPWLVLLSILFLIPSNATLLYGTRLIDPGRVGILLQTEVLVGIASAAILTAEPFGWREALGTVLVIGSGLTEVLVNRTVTRRHALRDP